MAKVVFEEEQRFTQWWLMLILLGVFAYLIKVIADLLTMDEFSNKEGIAYGFMIISLLLVLGLFAFSSMKSRIDENGVTALFKPFGFTKKFYSWSEIEKAELVRYHPLREYGGWGFRISFRGKGTAMNVKGNDGIRLHLKNGKQFLLGTQRPDQAKKAIADYQPQSSSKEVQE